MRCQVWFEAFPHDVLAIPHVVPAFPHVVPAFRTLFCRRRSLFRHFDRLRWLLPPNSRRLIYEAARPQHMTERLCLSVKVPNPFRGYASVIPAYLKNASDRCAGRLTAMGCGRPHKDSVSECPCRRSLSREDFTSLPNTRDRRRRRSVSGSHA